MQSVTLLAAILSILPEGTLGDLPVHCLRHQIEGRWEFLLGPASSKRSSCGHQMPDSEAHQPTVMLEQVDLHLQVDLQSPNHAQSAESSGNWTMIYDEALEVNIDGYSFLAFSRFELFQEKGIQKNISRCGETQLGWYRDDNRGLWGCFYGRKKKQHAGLLSYVPAAASRLASGEPLSQVYHNAYAATLNLLQDSWTAKAYERLSGLTLREINAMAGLFRPFSRAEHRAADPYFGRGQSSPSFLQKARARSKAVKGRQPLPTSLDWRNVSGANFLDKVFDQGDCGACYIIATTRMLSARHRIRQNDPSFEGFSINFPLLCSEYNQGCNGGYAFLASRWAQDVGLVPKNCGGGEYNATAALDPTTKCQLHCDASLLQRAWKAVNHHYVGGYYGGATEYDMQLELQKGPLVVSFEPKSDILYYEGGIYSSSPHQRTEWEPVDHAVLLVGYGTEKGQKYWLLQNSWGDDWGEKGFFRMARGEDESGVESIVVAADVVETSQPSSLLQLASMIQTSR
eukprot:TRINITY_DN105556_c0_g1_i1.p1 TRINITY_DN105556_c0_g1~~TRINITY_DN105556_c0_g1_i1.p1  ORF type:complete len:513 (-),score=103.41 TRINITY_DN105556_c0_g1_i1:18-1556(-)